MHGLSLRHAGSPLDILGISLRLVLQQALLITENPYELALGSFWWKKLTQKLLFLNKTWPPWIFPSVKSRMFAFLVFCMYFLNHRSEDIETLYMGADKPTLRNFENECCFRIMFVHVYLLCLAHCQLRFRANCLETVPNPKQGLTMNQSL